ncbi:MAG: TetR/AcrR family transcriptional regulator [Rhodoferax sp.]
MSNIPDLALVPPCRGWDRRTLRTRAALRDGLLACLHERAWDELSVQDICERANVGRSTFYTHFTSKEALLCAGFEDLRALLLEQARQHQSSDRKGSAAAAPQAFVHVLGLMEHVYDNRRVFRALVGKRSGYVVQRYFKDMLQALVASEAHPPWPEGVPGEAAVCWCAGALFELLVWWLDRNEPLPAQELHRVFLGLLPR